MSRTVFQVLYENYVNEENLDIILVFEDGQIKTHRLILSLCSPRFEHILENYDASQKYLFFAETSREIMSYIVEFMYKGEVAIPDNKVEQVLETAKHFQVKGIQVENVTSMIHSFSDKGIVSESDFNSSYYSVIENEDELAVEERPNHTI